jgi:hypothetical protein
MPGPQKQNQSQLKTDESADQNTAGAAEEPRSFTPPDLPEVDTFSRNDAEGGAALDTRERKAPEELPEVDTFSRNDAEGGAAIDELQAEGKPIPGAGKGPA